MSKRRDEERAMLRRVTLMLIDCVDDLEDCKGSSKGTVREARQVIADALTLMHGVETLPEGAREKAKG